MYKMITTAKRSGFGTISRELSTASLPNPEVVRRAVHEAISEWQLIYSTAATPIVDVTIRRD
jgi:hypothetical protein